MAEQLWIINFHIMAEQLWIISVADPCNARKKKNDNITWK